AHPAACAAPVRAGPEGLVLKLTFWRPQRAHIEGDPGNGAWMDVGHLAYAVGPQIMGSVAWCPQTSFSALDPVLKPLGPGVPLPEFVPSDRAFEDRSEDTPSDPANTFSATLNLTQCFASQGLPMPSGFALITLAAPISADPTSSPPASAISEAQFVVQP
ncbi:MAG: hypothetical protein ACM3NV_06760, partial [Syntrophothermus sp.]